MRRGCKAKWTVVENKKTKECIAFQKMEKDHYNMDGQGYKDVAITVEQEDADCLAACKNHDWDEDYIAFLEHQDDILRAVIVGERPPLTDEELTELIEKARSTSINFTCFGECGSLLHQPRCDFCYRKQHNIWNLCATICIHKHLSSLTTSQASKEGANLST